MCGTGNFSYLEAKYKEPQKIRKYDFGPFSNAVTTATEDDVESKKKFNPKHLDFMDENDEINPVQIDVSDSNYLFDNEDAIIVNLKKGNPNG